MAITNNVRISFNRLSYEEMEQVELALSREHVKYSMTQELFEHYDPDGGSHELAFIEIAVPAFVAAAWAITRVLCTFIENRTIKIEAPGYSIRASSPEDLKAAVKAVQAIASAKQQTSSESTPPEMK